MRLRELENKISLFSQCAFLNTSVQRYMNSGEGAEYPLPSCSPRM